MVDSLPLKFAIDDTSPQFQTIAYRRASTNSNRLICPPCQWQPFNLDVFNPKDVKIGGINGRIVPGNVQISGEREFCGIPDDYRFTVGGLVNLPGTRYHRSSDQRQFPA